MKLLYQTHSPYARKALVLAHEMELADQIEVIHHETSPTKRNPQVHAVNPLGKVPVLIVREGPAIFDSIVICDYLEARFPERRLTATGGEARVRALRLQAIAHGLCDAGIAVRYETERRPEQYRYEPLREGHTVKLMQAYRFLEAEEADRLGATSVDLGHIALATALDWLEFRALPGFRDDCPRLAAWLDDFKARPSMMATAYSGQTHD